MNPAGCLFRRDRRVLPLRREMEIQLFPPQEEHTTSRCSSLHLRSLEDLFRDYGVRASTVAKVTEMGFTVSTLVNMTEEEIEDVINKSMVDVELLLGERYGLKSAIRAEKRRQGEEFGKALTFDDIATSMEAGTRDQGGDNDGMLADAVGPLNMKEGVRLEQSHAPFDQLAIPEPCSDNDGRQLGRKNEKHRLSRQQGEDGDDRTREHPFIVTEPGEVARGKKNGLDYLFDLYEQCARFLDEVQQMAKERGEKCPTKVTNQVFRHAKMKGASYINKPKMRHYVHCYALHCLDLEKSNQLRKVFKERGENVGAWRQACYYPLVKIARETGRDIEGVFMRNEKLRIWYVPTKLRQLCHQEKSNDCDTCL